MKDLSGYSLGCASIFFHFLLLLPILNVAVYFTLLQLGENTRIPTLGPQTDLAQARRGKQGAGQPDRTAVATDGDGSEILSKLTLSWEYPSATKR